jgi:hypothetical protein
MKFQFQFLSFFTLPNNLVVIFPSQTIYYNIKKFIHFFNLSYEQHHHLPRLVRKTI